MIQRLLTFGNYDICILTTNYDTLIEKNLSQIPGLGFVADRLEDYVTSSSHVKLIKLHGSINWFKTLSEIEIGDSREHWFQAASDYGLVELSDENFVTNESEGEHNPVTTRTINVRGRRFFVFPALTAPISGKTDSVVCPQNHIDVLHNIMADCRHLIVIGSSGTDADVFDNVRFGSTIDRVAVVGARDATNVLDMYKSHYRYQWNVREPLAWKRGFGSYLGSAPFPETFRS